MEIREVFDSGFIGTVTDTLNTKCVEGETLTRAALCHELGLTEPLAEDASKEAKAHNMAVEAVVGALITLDVIEGFETRKGPGGGIGKVGERRSPGAKEPGKKGNRVVEFPEGFIDNLSTTLDTLCVDGKCVPRRDVAAAMGMPGSDTEALISAALVPGGLVAGFETRRGVGGGIRRSTVVPVAAEPATDADTTVEDTVEPTEDLAVEATADEPTLDEVQDETSTSEAEPTVLPEDHEPGFAKARKARKPRK